MKTELTIEESAKLIELGVDPKLASKCDMTMKIGVGVRGIIKRPNPKPIFTLTDILAILPKEIEGSDLAMIAKKGAWVVFYTGGKIRLMDTRVVAPELIDALYQLLCWTIEQKYYHSKN